MDGRGFPVSKASPLGLELLVWRWGLGSVLEHGQERQESPRKGDIDVGCHFADLGAGQATGSPQVGPRA